MGELITAQAAIVPSADTDRDRILSAIKEIDVSLVRIEGERDLIKDIADTLNEEFGMSKSLVNRLAKTYHAGNRHEVDSAHEEFTDFYDNIMK
jgi:hypothetical protein